MEVDALEFLKPEEFKSSSVVREHWPGFSNLKYLIIFGDSYSDVGWNIERPRTTSKHPSPDLPLGVIFPGTTWTGQRDEPNWVGHIIHMYKEPRLLVYNYAVGGAMTDGVIHQITKRFVPGVAKHPDWAPWKENDTLFIFWIGVNDVCFPLHDTSKIDESFKTYSELYHHHGARNFLFVNVPPRCIDDDGKLTEMGVKHHQKIKTWNKGLEAAVDVFRSAHAEATVLLYSAWSLFCRVYQDPGIYGFEKETHAFSAMWADNVHPSGAMHKNIAVDIGKFLSAVPLRSSSGDA